MKYAYLAEDNTVHPTNDIMLANKKDQIRQEHYKGFYVSTIFLPIDHSFGSEPPIHFETYVFESDGTNVTNWSEKWGRRSHTYDDALRQHEEAKKAIDSGEIPPGYFLQDQPSEGGGVIMAHPDTYYVFYNGIVYIGREHVGWKNAYRAAKRLHRKAFIISKHHHGVKKAMMAHRKRWAEPTNAMKE